MPNLDALRSRVERAERSLKSVQTTRDMESQALVEMWRQIRERYEAQESEIQLYRDKLNQVEAQHVELCKLVDTLLAVVEKSTGRAGDETVPRITGLAEAMLDGRDVDEASDEIEDEMPPRREAPRDMRGVAERVSEARRLFQDDDDKLEVDDAKEIEILRAELEQLGERMTGARRA
jgi:hypothetical protein